MKKNIKVIEVNEREVRDFANTAYIIHTYDEGDKAEIIEAWKDLIEERELEFDVYCVKYAKKVWGIGGMKKGREYKFVKLSDVPFFIALDVTSNGE